MATAAIAVAFPLVLILDGIFAGAMPQVTADVRHSSADVIVSQSGVRTMHMSVSSLPDHVAGRVRSAQWSLGRSAHLVHEWCRREPERTGLSYLDRLHPRALVAPRSPPGAGRRGTEKPSSTPLAADQLGLRLGDQVRVLPEPTSGSSACRAGGTSIVNTTTFITATDFAAPPWTVSELSPRHRPVSPPPRCVTASWLPSPASRCRHATSSPPRKLAIVSDMSSDILSIGSTIGFVIALAVIGLTLFTLTLATHPRGVLKAIGACRAGWPGWSSLELHARSPSRSWARWRSRSSRAQWWSAPLQPSTSS